MPSLVAEIGSVIEQHLKSIGVIKVEVDEHMEKFIKAKREEVMGAETGYPANATMCNECNTKATVMMDNCKVCLCCGSSKCN